MQPLRLVLRSLLAHPIATLIVLLNVSAGVMLASLVLLLSETVDAGVVRAAQGFSLVVGPPGSKLELILSTLLQRGESAGLLGYDRYRQVAEHPSTQLAVPYALGDGYRGYRVVATTETFFSPRFPLPKSETSEGKLLRGRPFVSEPQRLAAELSRLRQASLAEHAQDAQDAQHTEQHRKPPRREAVVGFEVAQKLGIDLGDQLATTHGSSEHGALHASRAGFEVVGILRPSRSPIDRVIWVNLEGFLSLPEHSGGVVAETGEPGISAAIVFPRAGVHKALLLSELSKQSGLVVAEVSSEVNEIFRWLGGAHRALLWVAGLVIAVGVCSVALSQYGSIFARRRELSMLRVLGATRRLVLSLVLAEAACIGLLGGLLGLLVSHLGAALLATTVEQELGMAPQPWSFSPTEGLLLLSVMLGATLGSLPPAFRAYRNDAAEGLA